MLHPLAWLCWLAAALIALSLTRNPLYVVLVLLCIAIVGTVTRQTRAELARSRPIRLIGVLIGFAALLNGLTVHYGDTVLVLLPDWLPVIGGPITAEAFAYGLLNGLVLTGFFGAFAVLTAVLSSNDLMRLLPPAFYPVAVVVSIAVSFVPTTLYQIGQIREAQAVRGHRLRSWRDWLPLWMPLLIGGLERALQLAEAMVARGFASSDEPRHVAGDQASLVGGLALLLGGWLLRIVWGVEGIGIALMVVGVGLVVFTLWRAGQHAPRTYYRIHQWRAADTVVAIFSLIVVIVLLVPLPWIERSSLFYYPYPKVRLPMFNSLIGIATLGLIAPALLLVRAPASQLDRTTHDYI